VHVRSPGGGSFRLVAAIGEGFSMRSERLTRRQVLRTATAGSTAFAMATLAKPFIHGAAAGGTLKVGLWDHWVPGGNEP